MKSKILVVLAILALVMAPLVFAQYGYGDQDDGGVETKPLSASFETSCEENIVTVTSKDAPLSDARVAVIQVGGAPIFAGNTDSNGQIKFEGCGMTVDIFVSKKNYEKAELRNERLVDCEQCVPPECTSDANCPSNERCVDGECVPVSCPCGEVRNHQCFEYGCCANVDCPTGQVCRNQECQPEFECNSDADCAGTQYCDIAVGAAGGNCADVTGACGYAAAHAWVEYECGDQAGCLPCPNGLVCVAHECMAGDMECPATAYVGEQGACEATVEDEPCANCDYEITDPAGNKLTGKTDENGNINIPFNTRGRYTVSLLQDGVVVKSMVINALPQLAVEEPGGPTVVTTGPDLSLLFLILFILFLILLLYWLSRRGKRR